MGRKGHGRACVLSPASTSWRLEVSWGFYKDPRRLGGEAGRRKPSLGLGRRFVLGLGGLGENCQRPRHLAGCKSPKGVFGEPSKVLLGERQKCPLGTLTPFAYSVSQPSLPNGTSGIAPSVFRWWASPGPINNLLSPPATRKFAWGGCVIEDAIPTGFKEQVQFLPLN